MFSFSRVRILSVMWHHRLQRHHICCRCIWVGKECTFSLMTRLWKILLSNMLRPETFGTALTSRQVQVSEGDLTSKSHISLVGQGPCLTQCVTRPTSILIKWHGHPSNALSTMHECDRWQTTTNNNTAFFCTF